MAFASVGRIVVGGLVGGAIAFKTYTRMAVKHCQSKRSLTGKTVIVTGSNSGVGKEAARDFARRGGRIIMACRNLEKAQAVADEIKQDTGNQDVVVKKLDLASLASVREFAADVNQNEARLDILANNAGLVTSDTRVVTADGNELILQSNYLGHFLLTCLLLPKLKANPDGARIVNTAALGHKTVRRVPWDDFQFERNFVPIKVYAHTKLYQIMMSTKLTQSLAGSKVIVNSLHPGEINTNIFQGGAGGAVVWALWAYCKFFGQTEVEGAQTIIYLGVDEAVDGVSGGYFTNCTQKTPSALSQNVAECDKLWTKSLELVGLPADFSV